MAIRPVPEITEAQQNPRLIRIEPGFLTLRRDPVEPVPVGTVVAMTFRVIAYDPDCDGSLLARLEGVDNDGESTCWEVRHINLRPGSSWIVDHPGELDRHSSCELGPHTTET